MVEPAGSSGVREADTRPPWMRGPALPLGVLAAVVLGMAVTTPNPAIGVLDDRSEYIAVSGLSGREGEAVVWMLDTRSEELIAVTWDRAARMLAPLGRRSLSADLDTARKGR